MANPTMTLIQSYTVGAGGVSSITFGTGLPGGIIPNTYTDLKLVWSGRSTAATTTLGPELFFNTTETSAQIRFANNNGTSINVNDTNIGAGQGEAGYAPGSSSTANTFGNVEIYIPNYNSTNNKSYSIDIADETNASSGIYLGFHAGIINLTSAITSIKIQDTSGSFVQYSTFYLYGIKNS